MHSLKTSQNILQRLRSQIGGIVVLKVLVLSECVATKKYDPSKEPLKSILEKQGLQIPTCDLENEERYKEALKQYVLPAWQMYEGSFNFIKELVTQLRKKGDEVQLFIISARYGLINESTLIIPYQCTFKCLKKDDIRERARKLKIYENLMSIIKNKCFDLSIVVLGESYLITIFDKPEKNFFKELKTRKLIVFGGKKIEREIECENAAIRYILVKGIGDRNKKIIELTKQLIYRTF